MADNVIHLLHLNGGSILIFNLIKDKNTFLFFIDNTAKLWFRN